MYMYMYMEVIFSHCPDIVTKPGGEKLKGQLHSSSTPPSVILGLTLRRRRGVSPFGYPLWSGRLT